MSHAIVYNEGQPGEVTFLHNGDFSGEVSIIVPRPLVERYSSDTVKVEVPFKALRALVLEAYRRKQISKLKLMTDGELWESMTS